MIFILLLCFSLTLNPSAARAQANSSGQLTIIIAAEGPEVKAGSDVWVKVTLTDNSSQDLAMKGGLFNRDYRFEVHDERGNLLPYRWHSAPGQGSVGSYFVQPGDSCAQSLCPSQLYDMSGPGKYTIQVFRALDSDVKAEIGSNLVSVTVVGQAVATTRPSAVIISPMNSEVEVGSEVLVNATFNDRQDDPKPLTGMSNPNYRFEIRDESGHLVKTIASPSTPLGMPYVSVLDSKETLTPGKYKIQAFRRADSPATEEITSNIITVTIQKPDLSTPPFTISVAVEKPEFKSRSNVYLQVAMVNDSPYDLNMSNAWPNGIPINWNYRFEVHDEAGKTLQRETLKFITGEPQTIFVGPGETYSSEEGVSYIYDMRAPGKYTIQVFRRASNDPKDGEIGSNIVTVTVVP